MSSTHHTVAFRCDASMRIGSGHVMRCLNLADHMQARGWRCSFIVNKEALHVVPTLHTSSYDIFHDEDTLPGNFDLAIIDHYELDHHYEQSTRAWAKKVLVIDDIFRRKHACDFLMNYATFSKADEDKHDIDDDCIAFFGLGYVILKKGFLDPPRPPENRPAKNVHLFFGASDVINLTLRCLHYIVQKNLHAHTIFEIVIADANPDKDAIIQICENHDNLNLYIQVPDISIVIKRCDLAFGVGGVAMWERLALGIPTVEFAHSEVQLESLHALRNINALHYAGIGKEIDTFFDNGQFEAFIEAPPVLEKLQIGHQLDEMIETIEKKIS
ncbi:MAG: UDP-2,4-diacetamido-2,4,6-trideoxy-beta-L-altropyranose hydrolase [Pseudomonadota bacterium]